MNPFEIIKDAFAPFMDGEKKPLHIGEAYNLWYYLTGAEAYLHNETVYYNIAENEELKKKLRELSDGIHKPIIHEIKEFLQKEGVSLSEPPVEKARSNHIDIYTIPDNARMSDKEIANTMAFGLIIAIQYAARGLTESVRADVGAMFAKYFMMKSTFSLTIKPMMEKNGWIRIPPYHKFD